MIDKDAKAAAARFMAELEGKKIKMPRSQNDEEDYDEAKQERDSKAVEEFVESDLFQYIKDLR
ncbi:MAG: hypothetical protein LBQ94_10230 [Treponema sp.]|jgi:hypothetical protein|nr:hypothetical protein [Treponema sp.]